MAGPGDRFGVSVETGGWLKNDLTLFTFGKRVEAVIVANRTASNFLVDVQVVRDPVFYVPQSPYGGHGNRTAVEQETYFYLACPANQTTYSQPFFARRGLKLKRVTGGNSVWGGAIVHGLDEGDARVGKA